MSNSVQKISFRDFVFKRIICLKWSTGSLILAQKQELSKIWGFYRKLISQVFHNIHSFIHSFIHSLTLFNVEKIIVTSTNLIDKKILIIWGIFLGVPGEREKNT